MMILFSLCNYVTESFFLFLLDNLVEDNLERNSKVRKVSSTTPPKQDAALEKLLNLKCLEVQATLSQNPDEAQINMRVST